MTSASLPEVVLDENQKLVTDPVKVLETWRKYVLKLGKQDPGSWRLYLQAISVTMNLLGGCVMNLEISPLVLLTWYRRWIKL